MIELLYLASQIQCGAGGEFLDVQVNVYRNQELVETIAFEDRVLLPVDSVNDLTFEYSIVNDAGCDNLATPTELVVAPGDDLPSMAGFAGQDSVQALLQDLNDYEELFLVELGTNDQQDVAFDLQDLILKVNNSPVLTSSVFPD